MTWTWTGNFINIFKTLASYKTLFLFKKEEYVLPTIKPKNACFNHPEPIVKTKG